MQNQCFSLKAAIIANSGATSPTFPATAKAAEPLPAGANTRPVWSRETINHPWLQQALGNLGLGDPTALVLGEVPSLPQLNKTAQDWREARQPTEESKWQQTPARNPLPHTKHRLFKVCSSNLSMRE